MAYIHVIDRNSDGGINILIHFTTPATDNSVGVPWKTVGLAMGLLGNEASPHGDPGEVAGIEAGDIVELTLQIPLDPTMGTPAQTAAQLTELADVAKANWIAKTVRDLDYYGYSQGTVS